MDIKNGSFLKARAWQFAVHKHEGQMYGQHEYMYHLNQVADAVMDRTVGMENQATYIAVAWLHDVIEDTDGTYDEIEHLFGTEIAEAVWVLTKLKGISYETYLYFIMKNEIAREVKICDTWCNLSESFKTGNAKGLAKYPRQLDILLKGVI